MFELREAASVFRAAVVRVQIVKRLQLPDIAANNAIKTRRNKYERGEENVTCKQRWQPAAYLVRHKLAVMDIVRGSTFQRCS